MKNSLLFILVFISFTINAENAIKEKSNTDTLQTKIDSTYNQSWYSQDKGQHLIGSMIGTILISQVSQRNLNYSKNKSNAQAAMIMFSVGLTKEILDSKKSKNYFSWKDLVANSIGIIFGVLLSEIK